MTLRFDTVSFLSDHGHADEFVGVVKSVIRSIAPGVTVVDITHGIAAHDVRAGGLALARSAQYLCPGVVLASVDPGAGTARRLIAVEVGDGMSVLVGPDNGVLAPAVAMVGGASAVVELTETEYQLAPLGTTFAGRDVLAPVAAHLCTGVPLRALGPQIDPSTLVPGVLPLSRVEGDSVAGEVLWVDHFGNLQLNVGPDEIESMGSPVVVRVGDATRTAVIVSAYGQIGPGELGLIVDSQGLLSLAIDRGSAAAELHASPGEQVELRPTADGGRAPGVTTSVTLTPRGTDR